jgi:hypothetical protein
MEPREKGTKKELENVVVKNPDDLSGVLCTNFK